MSGFDNARVDEEFFAAGKELQPAEQGIFHHRPYQVQFPVQYRLLNIMMLNFNIIFSYKQKYYMYYVTNYIKILYVLFSKLN